jgi:hypothetical protein
LRSWHRHMPVFFEHVFPLPPSAWDFPIQAGRPSRLVARPVRSA